MGGGTGEAKSLFRRGRGDREDIQTGFVVALKIVKLPFPIRLIADTRKVYVVFDEKPVAVQNVFLPIYLFSVNSYSRSLSLL
jgi:hypothetical protein